MSYMFVIGILRFLMAIQLVRLNFFSSDEIDLLKVDGAAILLPKHQDWRDIPLMGLITWAVAERRIDFLAKAELFANRIVAWQLRKWSAIPVKRFERDITAVRSCIRRLAEGKILCIFPEGTRFKGTVGTISDGAAFIGHASKCPPLIAVTMKYDGRTVNVRCRKAEYGQDVVETTSNITNALSQLWEAE